MPELVCRDAGFDCDGVVRGDTVDDVLNQARDHASQAHGVEVTPQMEKDLAGLVRGR